MSIEEAEMQNPAYVLGHSDRELSRLKSQARLLEPITQGFLREAGISEGMRVLDIGSGAGDVAFLAGELVGPLGTVVGVDRVAAAVAAATARAQEMGLGNVSFREGDPTQLRFDQPFDAVVGRYVLLFQADPSAMLASVVDHVRPRGLVVFHEPDWVSARSVPPAPTYDHCRRWLHEVFISSGMDDNMADKLYGIFVRAGVKAPAMRMQTFIGRGAAGDDFLEALADLITTLAPQIEHLGLATTKEIDITTLAARMKDEAATNGSLIIGRSEVGAWGRVGS
jgi:SAM-dependent methyltransferase